MPNDTLNPCYAQFNIAMDNLVSITTCITRPKVCMAATRCLDATPDTSWMGKRAAVEEEKMNQAVQ